MSADLPSPPNGPEPSPNGGEGEPVDFRRQKRRRRPDEDEPDEAQDQQIAVLTSLLANLMQNKGPSEPPPPKKVYWFNKGKAAPPLDRANPPGAARAQSPVTPAAPTVAVPVPAAAAVPVAPGVEQRDYSRYANETLEQPGSQEDAPAAPVPSHSPEVPAVANTKTHLPEAAVAPETVLASQDPAFWRSSQEPPPVRGALRWWYWVLTVLVGLGAYLAGTRMPAYTRPVATVAASQNPPQTWSDVSLARLDGILEIDQAGDLEKAWNMGQALQTEAGPLPGLEIYLNLLDARRRKLADAQSRFLKMAVSNVYGSDLAMIESALAFTYARQRRFSDASQQLEKAVAADPFAAESFRLLGESLRREGHFPQAVSALRQALLRYPASASEFFGVREYVRYKLRLAEIEGNLPVENRSPAAENGTTGDSVGYWFLSDAAAALQQGKEDLAAEALHKAKAVLPASLFERLLGDYFFRAYLDVPQVAAFFPANPDTARRGLSSQLVYFIDP